LIAETYSGGNATLSSREIERAVPPDSEKEVMKLNHQISVEDHHSIRFSARRNFVMKSAILCGVTS
jgi:hypothetical protein